MTRDWQALILWAVTAVTAAGLLGMAAACRQFLVIRVTGFSMVPSLHPGDRLLVRRASISALRPGMIVVLRDWPDTIPARAAAGWSLNTGAWLVKRLAAVPGDPVPGVARTACGHAHVVPDGMAVVLSDNESGGDSRTWGFAHAGQFLGYAISAPATASRAPGRKNGPARYRSA